MLGYFWSEKKSQKIGCIPMWNQRMKTTNHWQKKEKLLTRVEIVKYYLSLLCLFCVFILLAVAFLCFTIFPRLDSITTNYESTTNEPSRKRYTFYYLCLAFLHLSAVRSGCDSFVHKKFEIRASPHKNCFLITSYSNRTRTLIQTHKHRFTYDFQCRRATTTYCGNRIKNI